MHLSPRARTVAQSVALAAVGFGAVYLLATSLRADPTSEQASGTTGALSVTDALKTPPLTTISVRGFIFVDKDDRVLLCSQRTDGDPPFCDGVVMEVRDLDLSRLALLRGTTPKGNPWAWSDGPVSLLGSRRGAVFDARDVLPEEQDK